MTSNRVFLFVMANVLRHLTLFMISLMKSFSSLLSFLMDWMMVLIFSLLIPTLIRRETWSKGFHNSGKRVCLSNLGLSGTRKTKSRTKLVLWGLSANLMGPGFDGGESSRPRLLTIVMRSSMWMKW